MTTKTTIIITAVFNPEQMLAAQEYMQRAVPILIHGCGYCVAAHSMVAEKMSGVPSQAVNAIRNGEIIQDTKLAALSIFTRRLLQSRGLPIDSEIKEFLQAGYKEEQILEIVLAIAMKTISNYTNHLFNTPIDSAFASYALNEGQ
ncbi:MAG: carboxymuconolactone decarboxylase family protein [Methylovulum sp.]|nr:carboxymuconolactone decarboxylase family protein [Methylovulum sp.]